MKSAIIIIITVLLVFAIRSGLGLEQGTLVSGGNFTAIVLNLTIFVATYTLVRWVVEKVIPLGNLSKH